MSQRSDISQSIQQNFPDNTTNFITPTRLRNEQSLFLDDAILSEQTASIIAQAVTSSSAGQVTYTSFNAYTASTNTFTSSIQTQVSALRAVTSSYVTNAQTSSMSVLSASYALTASYARNAQAFPYSGSAQITGSLGVTGSILGSNQNGLVVNLGNGNTAPSNGANTNKLAFGNNITNNSANNGFAFGDNHVIANPGYNNFIAGGNTNTLNSNRGFAGGGINNTINAEDGATVGGSSNTINNAGAIILGGNGQTTIDDQTVHMNRANIGDWSSGGYVSFNQSGSGQVALNGGVSIIAKDNSSIEISGSTIPAVLRINASNYLDLKTGGWISTNASGFTTGSVGQVLTRSGSSIIWATPVTGSGGTVDTGSLTTTASFNAYTASTNTFTGSAIITASVSLNTITFTKGGGSTFNITVDTGSGAGGGMNLGANTFTGSQTISNAQFIMNSGSSASPFVTASSQFPNILMGYRGSAAQSGSLTINGKNNIVLNTGVNAISFSSSFAGNNNVLIGGLVNYTTQSMAADPQLNGNILQGTITITGSNLLPIVGANFTNNNIAGGILYNGAAATGSGTSNLAMTNNSMNATLIVSNSLSGSTGGGLNINANGNVIAGGASTVKFGGTRTVANTFTNNIIGGSGGHVFALDGGGNTLSGQLVVGSNLVVSSSAAVGALTASAWVGQWNETGSLSQPDQVRFAVGNGTSSGSRNTAFYVSASNQTVVKGAFIIENAVDTTVFSLAQSGFSTYDIIQGGGTSTTTSIPANSTHNFTATGGNTAYRFDIPTTVSSSFTVSGSTSISGSLRVNGNLQYNVGSFFSTASQSGSANVSQSITYNTTDISSGVSIVSGSQIALTNAGTYNIQFSAQVDRIAGSGTDTVNIWLKKNGANVSNSAGAITVSGGALAAKTVAAWNYVVSAAANDYYELVWQTTDSNIQLINVAATGNVPGIPSMILTVTQVR